MKFLSLLFILFSVSAFTASAHAVENCQSVCSEEELTEDAKSVLNNSLKDVFQNSSQPGCSFSEIDMETPLFQCRPAGVTKVFATLTSVKIKRRSKEKGLCPILIYPAEWTYAYYQAKESTKDMKQSEVILMSDFMNALVDRLGARYCQ